MLLLGTPLSYVQQAQNRLNPPPVSIWLMIQGRNLLLHDATWLQTEDDLQQTITSHVLILSSVECK